MIDRIIDYALKHRLLTILLVVLVSILGVIVYLQMPKDIYPDLNAPLVKKEGLFDFDAILGKYGEHTGSQRHDIA